MISIRPIYWMTLLILLLSFVETAVATNWGDPETMPLMILEHLICVMIVLAVPIMFTLLVVSGVLFVVWSDSPQGRESAKKVFKDALIGGVLVVATAAAGQFVGITVSFEDCIAEGEVPVAPPPPVLAGFKIAPVNGERIEIVALTLLSPLSHNLPGVT